MVSARVLVVDDAPYIRDILTRILVQAKFDVVGEAEDGIQAVAKAKELKPDLILMDIVMPHMSGVQATQEILKEQPDVKIIACTTLDQETVLMKALEAGAVDFVQKPFNSQKIVQIVQKVLNPQPKNGG